VTVVLRDDLTPLQRTVLDADLVADPLVRSHEYRPMSDEAFSRFQEIWRDGPSASPGVFTEEFRVVLEDPGTLATFVGRFTGRPGVARVADSGDLPCAPGTAGEGK
jgi:hypothetical protein